MKKTILIPVLLLFSIAIDAQSSAPVRAVKNTGTATSTFPLRGIFYAPSGISIILQNNGKNDLPVTPKKENGKAFTITNFNFPAAIAEGTKFKITAKNIPAGQTIYMYPGNDGIMSAATKVQVASDYTYDLITRSSNDASFSTFYESSDPAVGGSLGEEGRYVAFVSSAVGFAGVSGKHRQIFWRDRNSGITKLISTAPGGEEGNGDCYAPVISADGRSVAFESNASNLIAEDKNGVKDIFIWHSAFNTIERISVANDGKDANAESYEPSVSGDGNFVAFTSTASNISATEKGTSNNNVFLRDMRLGRTVMISIDPVTKKGGGGSNASIAYDGKRIAFYSHTSTLVSDDKNGLWDIFLWEQDNPQLKRISLTADGKERNQGIESANRIVMPSISGNGRYIAFSTTATNMVAGDDNNFQDVFIYDTQTGATIIASTGADGKMGNGDSPIGQGEKIAISFDGNHVAYSTNATNLGAPAANIVLYDVAAKKNRAVSTVSGTSVGRAVMSYSGSYVVFGIGAKLDSRFPSSGIFAHFTALSLCRFCPQ
jgi:Tol biopolymer transport system component